MKVLVRSHRGGYTLSREWVMEEYKNHLARKHRESKRPKRPAKEKPEIDLDNSEPWMENPQTVDDLVWIAEQVNQTAKVWGPR